MNNDNGLKMVAIIPARGGSKGIPGKNIQLLNGRPLLSYTITAALEAGVTQHVFVSTDSKEIAAIASEWGAKVIIRPAAISHDTASTESALLHAVELLAKDFDLKPEHILTLPPTSPLRSASTIIEAVRSYLSVVDTYDALLTLTENKGDFWRRTPQGNFGRLFPDAPRRRQDREPLYLENSAIYITKTASLIETGSILGKKCTGYVIPDSEATDINEPIDLKWVEFLLKTRETS